MREQRFSVILKGNNTLNDDMVELLYSRCDDVTAGSCGRIGRIDFDRPALSLNEAIASAIADLRACGLEVERIEIDPEDVCEGAHASV